MNTLRARVQSAMSPKSLALGSLMAAIALLVLAWPTTQAWAQHPPKPHGGPATQPATSPEPRAPTEFAGDLDATGNAHFSVPLILSEKSVQLEPAQRTAYVASLLARHYPAQVIEVTDCKPEGKTTLHVSYTVSGFARAKGDGQWEASLSALPVAVDKQSSNGNPFPRKTPGGALIFTGQTPWESQGICHLALPQGSSKLTIADGRLTYNLPPFEDPKDGHVSTLPVLEVKPRIMAALCKAYAYDDLRELWVARTVFKNTGQRTLTDYRVHFRIPEYTHDWSEWITSPPIIPGQTVVDAYFPLLDIDKCSRIGGTCPAAVEMECEYTVDGKVTPQHQSHKIEILGRNELLLSDIQTPFALSALVTKDDPVVQRVAAMVSRQIPGGIPSGLKLPLPRPLGRDGQPRKDYDRNIFAKVFCRELYRFMLHNKFSYQTEPGESNVETVKFARDVVLNKSGTCIDLAIFFASVCEAVGLDPILYLPQGHCFPGIIMTPDVKDPLDELDDMEVETTCLGPNADWKTAWSGGTDELKKPKPGEEVQMRVFVPAYRARNIHSCELPPLPEDVLERGNITPADPEFSLTGTWKCVFTFNSQQYTTTSTFTASGTCVGRVADATGKVVAQDSGTYTLIDGAYTFKGQITESGRVVFVDKDHYKYTPEQSTNPAQMLNHEFLCNRAD